MRKALFLVLTLVTIVACLTGLAMAVDKPTTVEESAATWKAVENTSGTVSYFAALNNSVASWAVEVDGGVTFTLLEDFTGNAYVEFPNTWVVENHPIVLDLNGHCITNTGTSQAFLLKGHGDLTIKNGTIVQNITARAIGIGYSSSYLTDTNGDYYKGIVTLENMFLYGPKTDANGGIIESKYKLVDLTLNNSYIWSSYKSTNHPEGYGVIQFDNAETLNVTVNNSVIGGTNGAFRQASGVMNLTFNNAVIVNNFYSRVAFGGGTTYINGDTSKNSNGPYVYCWSTAPTATRADDDKDVLLPNGVKIVAATEGENFRSAVWGTATTSAAPATTTADAATYMAVSSAGTVYFENFTTDVANWASTVPGGVTFYLLKDATHSNAVVFPSTWMMENPVTLDLNGHTLTSDASQADFSLYGDGVFTVQNGVYKHNGSGQMFTVGGTSASTAAKDGTLMNIVTVNVRNAFLHHTKEGAAYSDLVLWSVYNRPVVNVENSVIWSETNAFGCNMRFEQLVWLNFNVKDSIIGNSGDSTSGIISQAKPANSAADFVMNGVLTFENSVIATSDGTLQRAGWRVNVNGFQWGAGQDPVDMTLAGGTLLDAWSGTAPDGTAISNLKAQSFGDAPVVTLNSNVIFKMADGQFISAVEAPVGSTVTVSASDIAVGEGQVAGWNTMANGSGVSYIAGDNVAVGTTLYPCAVDVRTITFETAGGTAVDAIVKKVGDAVIAPANPTKTGYQFAGWDVDVPAVMPAENMTITASWSPINYTVEFNANGGDGEVPNSLYMTYDIADELPDTVLTMDRKLFAGWNTAADGNGESYAVGDSVNNLTDVNGDVVTLYAVWIDDPTADAPTSCDKTVANFKLTVPVVPGKVFYYETLSADVINWAVTVGGGVKIEALRNVSLAETVVFPADWNGANPIVIDLNGTTISNGAANTMFLLNGNGSLTIKNGYVKNNQATVTFTLGVSGTQQDGTGAYYHPALTFENAVVVHEAGSAATIYNYLAGADITMNNSILWTSKAANYNLATIVAVNNLGSGAGITSTDRTTLVRLTDSICGGAYSRVIHANTSGFAGRIEIHADNSAFVTAKLGDPYMNMAVGGIIARNTNFIFLNGKQVDTSKGWEFNGDHAPFAELGNVEVVDDWAGTLPDGTAIAGTATTVGTSVTTTNIAYTVIYDANGGEGTVASTNGLNSVAVAADGAALAPSGKVFKEWNTHADGTGTSYAAGENVPHGGVLYAQYEVDYSSVAPTQSGSVYNASFMIKPAGSTQELYYDALTAEVVNWMITVPGGVEVKVLKEVSLTASVTFPTSWDKANPVVIDLNGHTITNASGAAMFQVLGNGTLTIKNGYVKNLQNAQMITLGAAPVEAVVAGTAFASQLDGSGVPYKPYVNITNAVFYSEAVGSSVPIIYNYQAGADINLTNSILWLAKVQVYNEGVIMCMNNVGSTNAPNGADRTTFIRLNSSVLGGAHSRAIQAMNGGYYGRVEIHAYSAAFVTAKNGAPYQNMGDAVGMIERGASWVFIKTSKTGNSYKQITDMSTKLNAAHPEVAEIGGVVVTDWAGTLPDGTAITGSASVFDGGVTSVNVPYVVTYDANGGTGTVAPTNGNNMVATAASADGLTNGDLAFRTWNTKPDGTGVNYRVGANVPYGVTLYAIWGDDFLSSAPAQVPEAVANYKITLNDTLISAVPFYYAELTEDVINWVVSVDGGATITMLRDQTISKEIAFPFGWDASNPIVFDLGNNTLTNNNASEKSWSFLVYGNGDLTIKNGTMHQINSAHAVNLGRYSNQTTDAEGNPYSAKLTMENVFVYGSKVDSNVPLIETKFNNIEIVLINSIVWSANRDTTGGHGAITFDNGVNLTMTMEGSVIAGANRGIKPSGNLDLTISNSAVVGLVGTSGVAGANGATVSINGTEGMNWKFGTDAGGVKKDPWATVLPNGVAVSGIATVYGTVPNASPETVPAANAAISAVTATGNTVYFAGLDTNVATWAASVPGGVTLTLLKDIELSSQVSFNGMSADSPVVIDLNGFTMTHTASGIGIYTGGTPDLTVKNGTYISNGGIRAFCIGGSQTTDSAKLTLENAFVYGPVTNTNQPLIDIYYTDITLNILNSVVWSANTETGGGQGSITFGYATTAAVTLENSIVNGPNRAFRITTGTTNLTVTDSAIVTLASGNQYVVGGNGSISINGGNTLTWPLFSQAGATSIVSPWNATLPNGVEVTGHAAIFGSAPSGALQTNPVATVGGVEYNTLAAAIAAAEENAVITLLRNAEGGPVSLEKSLTLDFGGYTYSVTTPEEGVYSAMTIAEGVTVTLRNGTLEVGSAYKAYYDVLVDNLGADLTITDMTLDGTNLDLLVGTTTDDSYVLANAGGTVLISGETYILANDEGTGYAFDVCGTANVTVNTTGYIDGYIVVADTAKLTINSGSYSKIPNAKWLPAGKVPVSNADGSFSMMDGVIKNTMFSLSLEDWVHVNLYTIFEGYAESFVEDNGGMLVWHSDVMPGDAFYANADYVSEALYASTSAARGYGGQSDGIPVAEYGDTIYMRAYLKLADGNYTYGPLVQYSVRQYCLSRLANSTSAATKDVCAAMLNYGAAAQTYFNVNIDNLANAGVSHSLNAWSDSLLTALEPVNSSLVADAKVSVLGKSLSLNEKVYANFYYDYLGAETIETASLLVWDGVTEQLTTENVSYTVDMESLVDEETENVYYGGQSEGFISTEYGKTIFVCAKFTDSEGVDHYSEVTAYSPEAWASNRLNSDGVTDVETALCKALVQYGDYAIKLFSN
ncbi:MAG: InlB B-repeat-containing protein [Oscillospiraceae bacterium]|nr:InlB B-repeat-containing protein [Oscillospiraceae bacterium]